MVNIFLIFYVLLGLFLMFILFKNKNTFDKHMNITNAIHTYNRLCIKRHDYIAMIDYKVVEDYDTTLFRLWDWGYKRMVPKDIYELIKEYI